MTTNRKLTIKSYLIALPFFLVAVFLDQFSKWLAIEYLKEIRNFPLIEGVFSLHYLENRGAVFGIFYGWQAFLITLTIIISMIIFYFYHLIPHTKRHRWLRIATVLILSGAIGNLIDRIRLGFVVDFFFFELINFPVFNMADSYVVIACFLFLIVSLFYYKEEELDFIFTTFSRKKVSVDGAGKDEDEVEDEVEDRDENRDEVEDRDENRDEVEDKTEADGIDIDDSKTEADDVDIDGNKSDIDDADIDADANKVADADDYDKGQEDSVEKALEN